MRFWNSRAASVWAALTGSVTAGGAAAVALVGFDGSAATPVTSLGLEFDPQPASRVASTATDAEAEFRHGSAEHYKAYAIN